MKISSCLIFAAPLCHVAAQSSTADPLDQFISEAFSVYTQVTSILASVASAASAAATAPSSATSASLSSSTEEASVSSSLRTTLSSFSSPPPTSSSASTPSRSSDTSNSLSSTRSASASLTTSSRTTAIIGTSSLRGAAAESGTALPSSGNTSNDGNHNLAIILGSVLGALALGLFILALVICCKRRHRRSQSPRHRALSPGDDEVDSWRVSQPSGWSQSQPSAYHGIGGLGSAPLMAQHPAFRNQSEHENPFVPVPPPPRRTAPNSRAGLTDGMVPGDEPFFDKETGASARPSSSRSRGSSPTRGALAAGVVGAAAGAALMHHHKQQDDEKTLVPEERDLSDPVMEPQPDPQPDAEPINPPRITRKPVPINTVNNSEPWPYSPVSPIDPATEMAALVKAPSRTSQESRRSFSRDAARANAAFDQEYSPQPPELEQHVPGHSSGHGQALATAAAGLAAVGVAGAAMSPHQDRRRRSRSSSTGRAAPVHNEDPGLSSLTDNSREIYTDSAALAAQPNSARGARMEEPVITPPVAVQPQPYSRSDPYEIPPVPATRSRRNSALGTGAPHAAVYSFINRPAVPSPLSSEIRRGDRSVSPPRMASRSPRRRSRVSRASQDSTPYDDVYSSNPWVGYSENYYQPRETDSLHGTSDKAIVGDNGYPHMGIPRRKSGGEYDFDVTGPFGPQTVGAPPFADAATTTRSSTMNSDDSSWRLSSGMPGGWRRASGEYSRTSSELRRPGRLRASDLQGTDSTVERRFYDGVGQAL